MNTDDQPKDLSSYLDANGLIESDEKYYAFLDACQDVEDLLNTRVCAGVEHVNITGAASGLLAKEKRAARLEASRKRRAIKKLAATPHSVSQATMERYCKKQFEESAKELYNKMMDWARTVGLSYDLSDGPGRQLALKAVYRGNDPKLPRAKESAFTPETLLKAAHSEHNIHHFVQCVVPDAEMKRKQGFGGKKSRLAARTLLKVPLKERLEAAVDKHPEVLSRVDIPSNRRMEHFLAHRFFFFDLDYPIGVMSVDQLLGYLERISLKPFVRSIVETAPGRFHIYVMSQHIINIKSRNTTWKLDVKEADATEFHNWVKAIHERLGLKLEYREPRDALYLSPEFFSEVSKQAKTLKEAGFGTHQGIRTKLKTRREYTAHFLHSVKDIRYHKPGRDFIRGQALSDNYDYIWQRINQLLNGDSAAGTDMREAVVPFYQKWSQSLGRLYIPSPVYTNVSSSTLTISKALKILSRLDNEKEDATPPLPAALGIEYTNKFKPTQMSRDAMARYIHETTPKQSKKKMTALNQPTNTLTPLTPVQSLRIDIWEVLRDVKLENIHDTLNSAEIMDRIWTQVDWIGAKRDAKREMQVEKAVKTESKRLVVGEIPDSVTYFLPNRTFAAYVSGRSDYTGCRNALILDIVKYAHHHININNQKQVEEYWTKFAEPFLRVCTSGDLKDSKRGMALCHQSFLGNVKATQRALISGRLILPAARADMHRRGATTAPLKRQDIFAALLSRMVEAELLAPHVASVCSGVLFAAALANTMAINEAVDIDVYHACIPIETLFEYIGGRLYDWVYRLEKAHILRRSKAYHFADLPKKVNNFKKGHREPYSPKTTSLPNGGVKAGRGTPRVWVLVLTDTPETWDTDGHVIESIFRREAGLPDVDVGLNLKDSLELVPEEPAKRIYTPPSKSEEYNALSREISKAQRQVSHNETRYSIADELRVMLGCWSGPTPPSLSKASEAELVATFKLGLQASPREARSWTEWVNERRSTVGFRIINGRVIEDGRPGSTGTGEVLAPGEHLETMMQLPDADELMRTQALIDLGLLGIESVDPKMRGLIERGSMRE